MAPSVESFFDAETCTFSHAIYESRGSACAIVDSVLNYDAISGRIRGQLLRDAHRTRQHVELACADHTVHPVECTCRCAACPKGQRDPIPADSTGYILMRNTSLICYAQFLTS